MTRQNAEIMQDGKLPGQKVGRRWRFHKDAIDEWLKQNPETTRPGNGQ